MKNLDNIDLINSKNFDSIALEVFKYQFQNNKIYNSYCEQLNIKVETPKIVKPKPISLVEAMIMVESRGNDSAIGDRHIIGGEAVGCLQIRPIMLKEINRQLKRNGLEPRFELEDRYSRSKSIEMFNIFCDHYNLDTAEEIARCWNGGPRGINNPATVKYWEKVQGYINS